MDRIKLARCINLLKAFRQAEKAGKKNSTDLDKWIKNLKKRNKKKGKKK